MSDATLKWLVWIAGAIFILVGVVTFLWALFRDSYRGRKRCPRCWYDMTGAPALGLQCPECGRTYRKPSALLRTRRRYRWAGVGVLLVLLGNAGIFTRKAVIDGWPAAIPSSILVMFWPIDEGEWLHNSTFGGQSSDLAFLELRDRINHNRLADWQITWWLARVERHAKQHRRFGFEQERETLKKLAGSRLQLTGSGADVSAFFDAITRATGVPIRYATATTPMFFDPPLIYPDHACSAQELLNLLPSTQREEGGWAGLWDLDGGSVVTRADPSISNETVAIFNCEDIVRTLEERWRAAAPKAERLRREELIDDLCGTCDIHTSLYDSNSGEAAVAGSSLVMERSPLRLLQVERLLQSIRECPPNGVSAPHDEWSVLRASFDRLQQTLVAVPNDVMDVGDLLDAATAAGRPMPLDFERWRGQRPSAVDLDQLCGRAVPMTEILDVLITATKGYLIEAWSASPTGVCLNKSYETTYSNITRAYDVADILSKTRANMPQPPLEQAMDELSTLILNTLHPGEMYWTQWEVDLTFHFSSVGSVIVLTEPVQLHLKLERLLAEIRGGLQKVDPPKHDIENLSSPSKPPRPSR